ncbi:Ankyrin repeat domain-containing protein [Brevibacillus sp. IT-7CA2]|uniref:hypothetical protein n=1 Tax=Brevibacillus sp. IT-7CA2 TaxID=3026436 RepID=UPI0039DF9CA2
MDKQEAIDLINTLEVLDYEADGEALYYANVDLNSKTIGVLKSLGYSEEWIHKNAISDSEFDLTNIVWKYAQWWDGDKFVLERPDY